MDPSTYQSRYVETSDVPVKGPTDRFDVDQKRTALFKAENQAEMDLAGGGQIPQEDVTGLVQSAIAELATYYLLRDPTRSEQVTMGDMASGDGADEADAQQFRDEYDRIIESIGQGTIDPETEGTYIGSTTTSGGSVTVNQRDE